MSSTLLNAPWTLKVIVNAGVEPTIEQLNLGDICLNVADGRLFFRLMSGAITEFLSTQFLSEALLTQAIADQRYQLVGAAVGAAVVSKPNHGFSPGQAVCYRLPQGWELALNSEPDRLARALIATVPTPNTFTLARSGEIIGGLTDLQSGEWYHCSPDIPGKLAPVLGEAVALPGAYAANPLGQAVSDSALLFLSINPFEV